MSRIQNCHGARVHGVVGLLDNTGIDDTAYEHTSAIPRLTRRLRDL